MEIVKQPKYFQTWAYVSKLRRVPIVGQLVSNALQFICELRGHEPSKTEWGYGGGDYADTWCRWCNKHMVVPKSVIQFQQPHARTMMEYVDGKRSLDA